MNEQPRFSLKILKALKQPKSQLIQLGFLLDPGCCDPGGVFGCAQLAMPLRLEPIAADAQPLGVHSQLMPILRTLDFRKLILNSANHLYAPLLIKNIA